jgi:Zn-dependent protease
MTDADDLERRRAREIENLRAVYQSLQQPPTRPASTSHVRRNTVVGAIVAALLFIAGKVKILAFLASVFKFKTLATMFVTIGVYAFEWGLPFAVGFVLLIFVHELGHALAMWNEKIPAGAVVFIPFVGAFIAMRDQPRNAHVEARVAIAGPLVGSLGAWAVLGAGVMLEHRFLVALGHTAVLINLFNLVPVPPLDGGRIAGVFTKTYWVIGYAVGVLALLVTQSPLLLIVMLVGLWMLIQRWRNPLAGYDAVSRGQRLGMALGYAALVTALLASLPVGQELTAITSPSRAYPVVRTASASISIRAPSRMSCETRTSVDAGYLPGVQYCERTSWMSRSDAESTCVA